MKIGVIGAMHEEVERLISEMVCEKKTIKGMRTFYEGNLYGKSVVLVFSRWGKVSAATTVTQLIVEFGVDMIVFIGIAGGISPKLQIGDVVIGDKLFQHDMDASPLMPRYEIPLLGKTYFETEQRIISLALIAVKEFLEKQVEFKTRLYEFGINSPQVYVGDIASGDKFVNNPTDKQGILDGLPSVLCVEMEGAAVAQVCNDFTIPFLILRTISDTADDSAVVDFPVFLENIASEYAHYILKELLPKL